MRYYDTATRTEWLPGIHDDADNVIELPDDHLFFFPIPEGMALDFDDDGIPELVPMPPPTDEAIIYAERAWRNGELLRADIELNKVQDGSGVGTVSAWREYRNSLRDWPESKDFPSIESRPKAPTA